MRVLLDTNILLDVLLDRAPFAADSSAVWTACDDGHMVGFITASSLTDIYYIARRAADAATARVAISLRYPTDRKELTVLVIQTNGHFYLGWLNQVAHSGYDSQIAAQYLQGVIRLTGAHPSGTDGTRAAPISSLLAKKEAFLDLVRQFTDGLLVARQLEPE